MPKDRWEDVDGSTHQIGGDWWSKKWKSKPHVVPSPGGPSPQPKVEASFLVNGQAHVAPEPPVHFVISCGMCSACLERFPDLCEKQTRI